MSHLTYRNGYAFVQAASDKHNYSQSVVLPTTPPILKLSGQGGWDRETGAIPVATTHEELTTQFNLAFENVDKVLKAAGSRGWEDVFLIRVYLVGQEDGLVELTGQTIGKWCPTHRPVLTCVAVKDLGFEGMRVEVEVEALLSKK